MQEIAGLRAERDSLARANERVVAENATLRERLKTLADEVTVLRLDNWKLRHRA